MLSNPYDDKFTANAYHKVANKLKEKLLDDFRPSANPVVVSPSGQPSSDKTTLIQHVNKNVYPSKIIFVINGDEHRVVHPYLKKNVDGQATEVAKYTQSCGNILLNFLKNTSLKNNMDYLIEATHRAFEEHLSGIFNRYEKSIFLSGKGCCSPLKSRQDAYNSIPENCKLFLTEFKNTANKLHTYKRTYTRLTGTAVSDTQEIDAVFSERAKISVAEISLQNSWLNIVKWLRYVKKLMSITLVS